MNNIFEKKENKVIETIEMTNIQRFNTAMGNELAYINGCDATEEVDEFMDMTFQDMLDSFPEEILQMKMRDIYDVLIEVRRGNFDTPEKIEKFLKDRGYEFE